MGHSVVFVPDSVDYSQIFSTSTGSGPGYIYRYYGYPRQRGAGIFRVLRKLVPIILKSPLTQKLAREAAGSVGSFISGKAPEFASSPLGEQTVTAATNVLKDIGEGEDALQSLKMNARGMIRNLTGFGKKRKKRKPVAFLRNPKRNAKIVL